MSRRVSEGNLFSNSLQTYYVKHLCISCILELEERFCISLRPPSFAYKSLCLCLHEEVVQNILGGQTYSLTRKKCDFNVMLQWFVESGVSLGFHIYSTLKRFISASRFYCLWTEIYRQFSMFTVRVLSGYDNSRE